jgi:Virulence-associated protein E-like domain
MQLNLSYSLEDFPEAQETGSDIVLFDPNTSIVPVGLDVLPDNVSDDTLRLIQDGDDLKRPIGTKGARFLSRSEAVWAAVCDLVRKNVAPEIIAGLLLNEELGISASILEKRDPAKYAVRQVQNAYQEVSEGWPDVYKFGNPKPSMRNALMALVRLDIDFEYDAFHNRKRFGGRALQSYQGNITDDGCTILRKVIIDQFSFDPGKGHVLDAVDTSCLESRFHPILDYLDGLKWDGKPRITIILSKYFGADDTELNQAISKIMMLAAVRRVRKPGCKFDTAPILEGKQGSGKSTALKILAGDENFSDHEVLSSDAKSQMEALEGVWIYELCELEGLRGNETAKTKAFLSRQEDSGRPAYARFKETWPRQCIFVGTTNDDKYLKDETGNRRFWPVKTREIDLERLKRDRDQLWAEAAYWEAKGESILLSEDLWSAATKEQEARMLDDPWLDILSTAKGERHGEYERVSTTNLAVNYLEIPAYQAQPYHTKRIATLMRKLGWKGPKQMRFKDNIPIRGFIRKVKEADTSD